MYIHKVEEDLENKLSKIDNHIIPNDLHNCFNENIDKTDNDTQRNEFKYLLQSNS